MKTKSKPFRLLVSTAALAAFASFAFAGPGVQYWQAAKPVTTFSEAKAVGPNDTITMQCKGCKTVMIRDARHVGPLGKGHDEWATIGSKHACSECKGEITVAKGKTTDSMQHNCSKCGEGAVTCCVVPAVEKKK
jgi:hypothetical protein